MVKWIGGITVPEHPWEVLAGPQWAAPAERPDMTADPYETEKALRDKVGAKCPPALTFWALWSHPAWRHLLPLDMNLLEPSGPEFTSVTDGLEHYARRPLDGLGLRTGPQSDGWSLLGVASQSIGHFQNAVRPLATVVRPAPRGDRDKEIRDLRHIGEPAMVAWQELPNTKPYPEVQGFGVLTEADGDVDALSRLKMLELATRVPTSMWLVFHVRGRSWKRKRLGDGVELLAPGEVTPVAGLRGHLKVELGGAIQRPEPSAHEWLPPWLASAWGVKP